METKSIKELTEVIAGLEVLAVAVKGVMKDGKLDAQDLDEALALLNEVGTLLKAIEGITELPAEVKDIDAEEAKALVAKLIALVAKVKAV